MHNITHEHVQDSLLTSLRFTPSSRTFLISPMAVSWERALRLYLVLEMVGERVLTKFDDPLPIPSHLCSIELEMWFGDSISTFQPRYSAVLIILNNFSLCSSFRVLESVTEMVSIF